MDFFDEVGKKAQAAYKITANTATKLAKETKLSVSIAGYNSKMKDLYVEIGEKIYLNKDSFVTDSAKDNLKELFDKLNDLQECLNRDKNLLLELSKLKKCDECDESINISANFCPVCGKKQECIIKNVDVEIINDENTSEESASSKEE